MRPSADPYDRRDDSPDTLFPASANQPYDMHEVLRKVLGEGDIFEIQPAHAANVIVGFGRVEGRTVGVVANQPMVLAGCLDISASKKAARFVRFCDCFNIPILTFVDVPGFLPGTNQEHNGIIKHGAKLAFAHCEARRHGRAHGSASHSAMALRVIFDDPDHGTGIVEDLRRGIRTLPAWMQDFQRNLLGAAVRRSPDGDRRHRDEQCRARGAALS